MERLKSKWVWVSILAQIVVILQLTECLEVTQIEIINGGVTAILEILVLLGILNNPSNKEF